MPAPLPRQAATAGPTATSAKDYMLQLAALLSAPDVTQTGRCVSCEQPERGRKFQRLGGGRTWRANICRAEWNECRIVPQTLV